MQAVILAGGSGLRMRPRTANLPKILLPVLGRPFVAWLLPRLAECGFREVLLCIGYLGEQVIETVGDGARFGLAIGYSHDGARPLGTAGALRRALPRLHERFVVTYGDSYLRFDYGAPLRALARRPEMSACMAVYRNRGALAASNVAIVGDRVARYDPRSGAGTPPLEAIDYGATALCRDVIAGLPEGELGLGAVQAQLAAAGRMLAHDVPEPFFEIGSPAGLAALETHLQRSAP